jgi:enamine deaminase RidA (YjgF/YER057c/UK114 family)
MKRKNLSSGTLWEDRVGYSRAVRAGKLIFISGTTAVDKNGNIQGEGDMGAQTAYIINKMEAALNELGSGLHDVVRTRMFVTDISLWKQAGDVHKKFFQSIKPSSTLVEVKSMVDPRLLIEMEMDAVMGNKQNRKKSSSDKKVKKKK